MVVYTFASPKREGWNGTMYPGGTVNGDVTLTIEEYTP
jgi:hypothetical protein